MRYYSNTGKIMSLQVGVGTGDTTLTVNDASGLPVSFPYEVLIDQDLSSIEIVEVTGAASNVLTVIRGRQDTSAHAHSVGAVMFHAWTAADGQDLQNHIAATQNVHGIGASNSVVGTGTAQTLTNKTINGANNTLSNIPGSAVTHVPIANIDGDWPIDTRSTGNLPIDTRTTGNLPIDTRTSGNLPGSRISGSITTATLPTANLSGSVLQAQLGALNNVSIGQSNAALPALTLTPNASATADLLKLTTPVGQTGFRAKRDTSSTSGNFTRFDTEADAELMSATRSGVWRGTNFVLIGSPDRDIKAELDALNTFVAAAPRGQIVAASLGSQYLLTSSFSAVLNTTTTPVYAGRDYLIVAQMYWDGNNVSARLLAQVTVGGTAVFGAEWAGEPNTGGNGRNQSGTLAFSWKAPSDATTYFGINAAAQNNGANAFHMDTGGTWIGVFDMGRNNP